ncbi:unnamed protein product [Rotaria sordida]|uniref:PPIase cyclophilin-type domain-containing protein n=1 Tax=Rotaria sordida TaxID=392033 RepID=A0A814RPY6_9BILA|nr:unnamed protein product [Rotaria sordida]
MEKIATIKDEKLADKIDAGDKKKINDTIEETLKWLELNQRRAETEEFEHKLKEIERICLPLMIKLYDGTGGPHSGAGGNSAEPTIELIKKIERICSPLMIKLYGGAGGPHLGAGGNSAESTIELIKIIAIVLVAILIKPAATATSATATTTTATTTSATTTSTTTATTTTMTTTATTAFLLFTIILKYSIHCYPSTYCIRFDTNIEGQNKPIIINVTQSWSPLGANHLYDIIHSSFYSVPAAFFRVVPKFVVQFGISGDPTQNVLWNKTILDDPVKISNLMGTVSYATDGPNTRTTQLFINYDNNSRLDALGFSPLGN